MSDATLVIVLGAHAFPEAQALDNAAFLRSRDKVLEYFRRVGVPSGNVLDLFDEASDPSSQLTRIADFLGPTSRPVQPANLVVYYVGHGILEGPGRTFLLAIRRTRSDSELYTSLPVSHLAHALGQSTGRLRKFVILDCCFAGAEVYQFQPGRAGRRRLASEWPAQGTAVMCSSGPAEASRAPPGHLYTMFSGALIKVLFEMKGRLSFQQIYDEVLRAIEVEHGAGRVRPELHDPGQAEGRVSQVPLFDSLAAPVIRFPCAGCGTTFRVEVDAGDAFSFPCPKCAAWLEHVGPRAGTLGPPVMYVCENETDIYPLSAPGARALVFPVQVKPPSIESVWTQADSVADLQRLQTQPSPALLSTIEAKRRAIGAAMTGVSPAHSLTLEILSLRTGHAEVVTAPLSEPVIIGRLGGNVVLEDLQVSRLHGWIVLKDGALSYERLSPRTLTYAYIGGFQQVGQFPLRYHDLLKLGSTLITVRSHGPEGVGRSLPPPRLDERRIAENLLRGEPTLSLRGCGLSSLSPAIGALTHLVRLDLSDNHLTALPSELGRLEALEVLILRGNDLAELPEWLLGLRCLRALYLHDNPRLPIPREILGPGEDDAYARPAPPLDILHYFLRLKLSRRQLNEAKLILVGRGGVGKTCVVNRLTRDVFVPTDPTEGIKISVWNERLEFSSVKFNIWDFGGQDIMHATHQFFLTERAIYLLIVCGREDLQEYDINYWVGMISSFGGDSPIILVFNKAGEFPSRVTFSDIKRKHPQVALCVPTDCETGSGIAQLRDAIAGVAAGMESIRVEFPEVWFAIKNRVATLPVPYISLAEFRELCHAAGEVDEAQQDELLRHLHNLGIALNYPDEFAPGDTNVLNPRWLTEGVYGLLRAPQIERAHGVFSARDLSQILPRAGYPAVMHRTLIRVMLRFRICLPLGPHQYLIPALLPDEPPFLDPQVWNEACLAFDFKYSVLPEGLLPRFIATMHERAHQKWRSGVVLHVDECRALVTANRIEREISLRVQGRRDRRAVLAVIRHEFDRLHREYARLEVRARVPIPGTHHKIDHEKLRAAERDGRRTLDEYLEDERRFVAVDVQGLLSGVDEVEAPCPVVVIYAQEEPQAAGQVRRLVRALKERSQVWTLCTTDAHATGGELERRVAAASLIVWMMSQALVSAPQAASGQLVALRRLRGPSCQEVAVLVGAVALEHPLLVGQAILPERRLPLSRWSDPKRGWNVVQKALVALVEALPRP